MSTNEISAATKALADAVSVLTKSVVATISERGDDINTQVAQSLRAASAELSEASARMSRTSASPARTRADRTRELLVDAACTLFAERGFEATSLGDVAAKAGYTKGAVYANFASKQELLLAVVAEMAVVRSRHFTTMDSPSAGDVVDLLPTSADGTVDNMSLLGVEIALYAARHPEVRPAIAALLAPGQDALTAVVASARDSDPDHPTTEDVDAALGIVALGNFVQVQAGVVAGPDAADAGRRLVQRLLES